MKTFLTRLIYDVTGYTYDSTKPYRNNVWGVGLYISVWDSPTIADPAHVLKKILIIRIGNTGFQFFK